MNDANFALRRHWLSPKGVVGPIRVGSERQAATKSNAKSNTKRGNNDPKEPNDT